MYILLTLGEYKRKLHLRGGRGEATKVSTLNMNITGLDITTTGLNSSFNATKEEFKWGISGDERIINFAFLSLVAIVTICGNVIALHAFIVSPELKRNTYYFIASLCVSDLMVACLSIPMWLWMVMNNFQPPTPSWVIKFHSCLDIFCGTLSIMSLAMIGVERFICIKHALRYHQILTTRRVQIIIVLLIGYSVICTTVNYLVNSVNPSRKVYIFLQCIILSMAFLVPVTMKIFSYGNIYQEAKRQIAEINKHQSIGIGSYDDDAVGDNVSMMTDVNDNDSGSSATTIRYSQSRSSCVSWTTSPLAKRKEKVNVRESITTSRSYSPDSDGDSTLEKSSLGILKTLKFKKSIIDFFRVRPCYKGGEHQQCKLVDSNENLDNFKSTRTEFPDQQCKLTDSNENLDNCNFTNNLDNSNGITTSATTPPQSCTINRQNTNTSIKSILKKKSSDEESESSYLIEATLDGSRQKISPEDKLNREKKQKRRPLSSSTGLDKLKSDTAAASSSSSSLSSKKTNKKPRKVSDSIQESPKRISLIARKSINENKVDENMKEEDKKERARALSCPANKSARQSLEVSSLSASSNGAGIGFLQKQKQDNNKGIPGQEPRKGSSSPFLRRFRGESKSSVGGNNSPSLNKRLNKQRRHEQKVRRFRKEIRAAKVVGFIMGTFLICWTPFMVFVVMTLAGYEGFSMRSFVVAISLHYLNSAINPILYVMLNKVYRKAVVKAFKRLKYYFNCE